MLSLSDAIGYVCSGTVIQEVKTSNIAREVSWGLTCSLYMPLIVVHFTHVTMVIVRIYIFFPEIHI